MKQRLTDGLVKSAVLPEGRQEAVIWDTEVTGFGLRLRTTRNSYILAYRPVGSGRTATMKKLKLGTPQTVETVAEARKLARVALGRILTGADPAAERADLKRRAKSRLADLLTRYDAELERRGYVNRSVVIAGLRKRLGPFLHQEITALTGSELATIIERVAAEGRQGAAEDFRSRCRAFLSWCVSKAQVINSNPLIGLRKERSTRADKIAKARHGRALTPAELRAVWAASPVSTVVGRVVRFLILTGCRRGEAAGLTWGMVDRPDDLLRLPAAFVKQGRGHLVPITPELAQLLDTCTVTAGSDLVFASQKTGGPLSGWSKFVGALTKDSGVAFTLHDFRRTFRTGLSQLGVDEDTAEIALGHARTNLEATYNRDDALAQLRAATTAWAAHVSTAVGAPDAE